MDDFTVAAIVIVAVLILAVAIMAGWFRNDK